LERRIRGRMSFSCIESKSLYLYYCCFKPEVFQLFFSKGPKSNYRRIVDIQQRCVSLSYMKMKLNSRLEMDCADVVLEFSRLI